MFPIGFDPASAEQVNVDALQLSVAALQADIDAAEPYDGSIDYMGDNRVPFVLDIPATGGPYIDSAGNELELGRSYIYKYVADRAATDSAPAIADDAATVAEILLMKPLGGVAGASNNWATTEEKQEGSVPSFFSDGVASFDFVNIGSGDKLFVAKTTAYDGQIDIKLGTALGASDLFDSTGVSPLVGSNAEARVTLPGLVDGATIYGEVTASGGADTDPVEWCLLTPFYTTPEAPNPEYDYRTVSGAHDLTTNGGGFGKITLASDGITVVTYGAFNNPQTLTLGDGETLDFNGSFLTGYLPQHVNNEALDLFETLSAWTYGNSNGGSALQPLSTRIHKGQSVVVLTDSRTNTWEFIQVNENLPLTQPQKVFLKFAKIDPASNGDLPPTVGIRMGRSGAVRDVVINPDTGHVVRADADLEVLSVVQSGDFFQVLIEYQPNSQYTQFSIFPAYGLNGAAGSSQGATQEVCISELDVNYFGMEASSPIDVKGQQNLSVGAVYFEESVTGDIVGDSSKPSTGIITLPNAITGLTTTNSIGIAEYIATSNGTITEISWLHEKLIGAGSVAGFTLSNVNTSVSEVVTFNPGIVIPEPIGTPGIATSTLPAELEFSAGDVILLSVQDNNANTWALHTVAGGSFNWIDAGLLDSPAITLSGTVNNYVGPLQKVIDQVNGDVKYVDIDGNYVDTSSLTEIEKPSSVELNNPLHEFFKTEFIATNLVDVENYVDEFGVGVLLQDRNGSNSLISSKNFSITDDQYSIYFEVKKETTGKVILFDLRRISDNALTRLTLNPNTGAVSGSATASVIDKGHSWSVFATYAVPQQGEHRFLLYPDFGAGEDSNVFYAFEKFAVKAPFVADDVSRARYVVTARNTSGQPAGDGLFRFDTDKLKQTHFSSRVVYNGNGTFTIKEGIHPVRVILNAHTTGATGTAFRISYIKETGAAAGTRLDHSTDGVFGEQVPDRQATAIIPANTQITLEGRSVTSGNNQALEVGASMEFIELLEHDVEQRATTYIADGVEVDSAAPWTVGQDTTAVSTLLATGRNLSDCEKIIATISREDAAEGDQTVTASVDLRHFNFDVANGGLFHWWDSFGVRLRINQDDLANGDIYVNQIGLTAANKFRIDRLEFKKRAVVEEGRELLYNSATNSGTNIDFDNGITWQDIKDKYEKLEFDVVINNHAYSGEIKTSVIETGRNIAVGLDQANHFVLSSIDLADGQSLFQTVNNATDASVFEVWGVLPHGRVSSAVNANDVPINDQSSSGYVDIGAMRIQWGVVGASVATGTEDFPAPFADVHYSIVLSNEWGNFGGHRQYGASVVLGTKTTTSFIFVKNVVIDEVDGSPISMTGASGEPFSWIAMGLKP